MSTSIEWTDETWNPAVGCERVSPGCDNCYAVRVAARQMQPAHEGLTVDGEWTGEVRLLPERLEEPLRWRHPRRVFVGSMTDLFHPSVPANYIADVFAVMVAAGQHTFQLLTKRPQRMATILRSPAFYERVQDLVRHEHHTHMFAGWPYPSIWLGTSIENQRYADLRIPHLLAAPAARRFLSVEPLLGPVDLSRYLVTDEQAHHALWAGILADPPTNPKIDWVIVGGESGPGARPMHPQWVRDLRDQCVAAGVPFFFKQWGEWRPGPAGPWTHRVELDGSVRPRPTHEENRYEALAIRDGLAGDTGWHGMTRVGKKAAGRELEGRTWDEVPAA